MNETKRHILDVSLRLFLQKNFKEVTLKEIVEKSGMSKGAFYHYFESKEQLFQEVIDDILASIQNAYRHKLRKDSLYHFYHDYSNYLTGLMEYLFFPVNNEIDTDCTFNFFAVIFDALKLFPDFQEKILAAQQSELDTWREVIRAAKDNGEIQSVMNDELIARMFTCSSDGVGIQSIVTKETAEATRTTLLRLWDGFYEVLKK